MGGRFGPLNSDWSVRIRGCAVAELTVDIGAPALHRAIAQRSAGMGLFAHGNVDRGVYSDHRHRGSRLHIGSSCPIAQLAVAIVPPALDRTAGEQCTTVVI